MKLFNTLSLEINAQCNRSCKFCPVAYNSRPNERMQEELVMKAIKELAALKYKGRIEWYIYNEPFKDKEWTEFCITTTKKLVPTATQMIATNGDYLKGSDEILHWFNLGLNQLLVNCYSVGLYEKRLPWIEAVEAQDNVKINGDQVYAQGKHRQHHISMLDKSVPEEFGTGIFRLTNRAGNIEQFIPKTCEAVPRMCVRPFRLLNINWRGEPMVCCQDYHADVTWSNLKSASLVDIWNHPVLNTYREHLLRKDRTLPLCNVCDCHSGAYPGNVDKSFGKTLNKNLIHRYYQLRVDKRNKEDK